jgi:hypothetical protein
MRISTIVPIPHLGIDRSGYHMCLAHLMSDPTYLNYFKERASLGDHVLMDNGSVETGKPLPDTELFYIAENVRATEMTLPDHIRDKDKTMELHDRASGLVHSHKIRIMGIPQGATQRQWTECASWMLSNADRLGIGAIGVSRFQYGIWPDRADAILSVPGLVDSDLEIHLLGCWGSDPTEAFRTSKILPPGRIRGIDSGIAAMFTQGNARLGYTDRPVESLDFNQRLNRRLLEWNIDRWIRMVTRGRS